MQAIPLGKEKVVVVGVTSATSGEEKSNSDIDTEDGSDEAEIVEEKCKGTFNIFGVPMEATNEGNLGSSVVLDKDYDSDFN